MNRESADRLEAVRTKITATLATKPECFITHPSELAALKVLAADELKDFAEKNGWRTVRRVGGRQIEFYNDATVLRGRFTAQVETRNEA